MEDVYEKGVFDIWKHNLFAMPRSQALASSDADLALFASSLSDDFEFIDLRNPKPGDGFSWGRYGPRTVIKRHGTKALFAYQRQEQKGWLSRLFGA